MSLSGSVGSNKDSAQVFQPLLLAALYPVGSTGSPLLVSTHALDTISGPTFPGLGILPAGNYLGRVAQQDISALQQRSQLGIDRIANVTLHLMDADGFLWTNYCIDGGGGAKYGFRGATIYLALVLWEVNTANFSSDAPVMFVGTCDMEIPTQGGNILVINANNSHNTSTIRLPLFPIQNRCPLHFPVNAAERALSVLPDSKFCPYSQDQSGGVGNTGPANHFNASGDRVTDGSGIFVMCDFTRSNPNDATIGCMARLGKASATSVAPDGDLMHDQSNRRTGAFAGVEWAPSDYYAIVKNYSSGQHFAAFNFLNQAVLGQFQNLLYGTQMVVAKIASVVESGNDTKMECMICTGDIGETGVQLVVVNGIQVNENGLGAVDPSLRWNFADVAGTKATGGRFGAATKDFGYNLVHGNTTTYTALGDTYGSVAMIEVVCYKDIFTGSGIPTVQVRATGPRIWLYTPITTSVADGSYPASSWAFGPPGTVTLSAGLVTFKYSIPNRFAASNTDTFAVTTLNGSKYLKYQAASNASLCNANPAWVLLDLLVTSNWKIDEINLDSFAQAGEFCDTQITYVDATGTSQTHSRFKCQFVQESRATAAEIISGVLRSFNGYLYWDQGGLLNIGINQTLADQQPASAGNIPGSNYNTNVASVLADGTSSNGKVAYKFDDTNIARVGDGDNQRIDIEAEANATLLTPNRIFIQFQDEDNQFVVDSLGEIDADAVSRAGGSLQPGGNVIDESLTVKGIPNFDQAVRIANVYLAERQRGNEAGDPRGTRVFTFGTTFRAEHLRVGHLILLSLIKFNITNQLFRVIKIQPSTDFMGCRITVAWHQDVWYTDIYGQAPQAYYSQPNKNVPVRPPLPWQPSGTQPFVPTADDFPLIMHNEYNFRITEVDTTNADGSVNVQLQLGGIPPVNQIDSQAQSPLIPITADVSTTGGTIPGGQTLYFQICGLDTNGKYSAPSGFCKAVIPSTTNTNKVDIDVQWTSGTTGHTVFGGTDNFNITYQQTAASSIPATVTITSLPNVLRIGPPDLKAGSIYTQAKSVIRGGVLTGSISALDSTSITLTATIPPTNDFTDYHLMLVGREGLVATSGLRYTIFTIASNAGAVLTLDRDPTVGGGALQVDDVIVILPNANISSLTTIGDANFINSFNPTGVDQSDAGAIVRIIAGKGRYQTRTIDLASGGTTTLSAAITSTGATSISVTSGANIVNGYYIKIDDEYLKVSAGGGTSSLTVTRHELGSTAATHLIAADVVIGGTTYNLTQPWDVIPDSTSLFIVEEAGWRYHSDTSQINASDYTSVDNITRVDVSNYTGHLFLVQALIGDAAGDQYSSEARSPFRLFYVFGEKGGTDLGIWTLGGQVTY